MAPVAREMKGGVFEAVDRASNSKGLLTQARSEAGRGPACTVVAMGTSERKRWRQRQIE